MYICEYVLGVGVCECVISGVVLYSCLCAHACMCARSLEIADFFYIKFLILLSFIRIDMASLNFYRPQQDLIPTYGASLLS